MINVLLWVVGIVLVALAAWRVRGPLARANELDRLAENAKRYESWRGASSSTAAEGETTGADVMRAMLRRQVYTWIAVGVVGIVLIIVGFAIR